MRNLLYFFIVWVLGLPSVKLTLAEETWRAAAGRVAITPVENVWMAGYAARDKPSEGTIHDLFAKVLILEDPNQSRIAIVTLDLIGVTPEIRSGVESMAMRQGIEPESLLLNASHTHCGPELRSDRMVRFGIDPLYAARSKLYVESLIRKIGDLIESTTARLVPSRVYHSMGRAGFAMNRRLPLGDSFANSPNPDGPVDHEVPVLRVEDSDKKLTAILFGYACHNTTLSFNKLCGDYAGFAQEYLEAAHPDTVAMFMNGCSADQNPYPRRTFELAQQHGRALANGVETALETKRFREVSGSIRSALENIELKFAPAQSEEELKAELNSSNRFARIHAETLLEQQKQFGTIPTSYNNFPIQVIQFGDDLTLVAICGEVVIDYGLRLKRELQTEPASVIWVAGYSNYVFGYLPSLRVLKEGGYEGGGAMLHTTFPGPFDESVEDRVVEKVKELVKKVRTQ